MAAPILIDNNLEQIVNEWVADFEIRSGRTLSPSQLEMLLIEVGAYRESVLRSKIQYVGEQNLVDFASGTMLEYLGQIVGVNRLAASYATVSVRYTLVSGHGGVTIPSGNRVSSTDGIAVFVVTEDVLVLAGTNTVDITLRAINAGAEYNNRLQGTITTILDPLAFVSSVTNTTISGGGADIETDNQLRERIKLAPSSFSNAGSYGAYRYWSRTASPAIIDVAVLGPPQGTPPGEVHVYPLMADGNPTPQTVLDAVYSILDAENIRPLNDYVEVNSPFRTNYNIDVDVTILTTANPTEVQNGCMAALQEFADGRRTKLGLDVMLSKITERVMSVTGVYNVAINDPISDLIINNNEFAYCVTISVNIIGTNIG